MKLLEWILIKLLGNTNGFNFNMWDWDILTLGNKTYNGIPFTQSEIYAKIFLEQMGEVMKIWNPSEKWQKPYGDVLNEHRKLH